MTLTLNNLHRLNPCSLCDVRMAVPGSAMCTTCEAEILGPVILRWPDESTQGQQTH